MIKYIKTLWENTITPVNGKNMNKIEDALEYLHDLIRNVPDEENVRISNEKQRQTNETTRSNDEIKRNATFDNKIKDVDKAINDSNENIKEVNNKFESITASKQQDAEVIISRDREVSLNARLKRDLYIDDVPLKQRVLDLEGLKEMQDFEYETDKGYLVCKDTKNGVVKDLKLKGKTVVNVLPKLSRLGFGMGGVGAGITNNTNGVFSGISSNGNYYVYDGENIAKVLYPNSQYTVKGFIEITCTIAGTINIFYISLVDGVTKTRVIKSYKLNIGKNYIPINEVFITDGLCSGTCGFYANNVGTISDLKFMFMMLQGDVFQLNINSYIEGIASVGNGNQIEVSSVKSDGNLFDTEGLQYGTYNGNANIGTHYNDSYTIRKDQYNRFIGKPIRVPNNSNLYFKCGDYQIARAFFDKDLKYVRDESWQSSHIPIQTKENEYYISSYIRKVGDTILTNDDKEFIENNAIIEVTNDYQNMVFKPYKADKKPILYKDVDENWKPITELRGIDLTNCDTIEKHSDDKHYLHVRTGKRVLNGSENWVLSALNQDDNTICFQLDLNDSAFGSPNKIDKISDEFPSVIHNSANFNSDFEFISGLSSTSSNTGIRILKSRLETQDIAGFKKWLQTNNVTVIYQLAKEQIYEVNPLDLESFEGETMISIDGGVVAPYARWKITSYLPNFVRNLSSQVRQLQDQVYKTNVANFTVALNTLDTKLRLNKLEAPND
ncbi:hypothetical protein LZ906_006780 [Paraclostridium ghonii]|uniref:hypothetical protein n=1 Tax=Paraclostridium ghonii TaxID=29358 RepID=UPI003526120E